MSTCQLDSSSFCDLPYSPFNQVMLLIGIWGCRLPFSNQISIRFLRKYELLLSSPAPSQRISSKVVTCNPSSRKSERLPNLHCTVHEREDHLYTDGCRKPIHQLSVGEVMYRRNTKEQDMSGRSSSDEQTGRMSVGHTDS